MVKAIFLSVLLLIFGCTEKVIREVASVVPRGSDPMMEMAENGILVILTPMLFQDRVIKTYGSCRSEFIPEWPEKFRDYIQGINNISNGFSKFHLIELDRAVDSNDFKAQIIYHKDGPQILRIPYRKVQKTRTTESKIDLANMECSEVPRGGRLIVTDFEWAPLQDVLSLVQDLPIRNSIPAWKFDRSFLKFLASLKIFPMTDKESIATIDGAGGWVLQAGFDKWSMETSKGAFMTSQALEKWLILMKNQSNFSAKMQLMRFKIISQKAKTGILVGNNLNGAEMRSKSILDPIIFDIELKNPFIFTELPSLLDYESCLLTKFKEAQSIQRSVKGNSLSSEVGYFSLNGFYCLGPSI